MVVDTLRTVSDTSNQPCSSTSTEEGPSMRGARFYLIFFSICISLFLPAFDLTGLTTALPTIIRDLNGQDFAWVGSAYALSSTASLPMCGGLAEIFGRRIAMIITLLFFAVGSALCGAAQSMEWLIAARVVQGFGAGGLQAIPNIIVSDLVPLSERGAFQGILGLVWAFASAIAPLISGALANANQWRWFFYLNIPLCGIAFVAVMLFLQLPTPPGTFSEKLSRIDWIGNTLFVASTTAIVLGLTWGGITYSWKSAQVLSSLALGFFGFALFAAYEGMVATNPILPLSILRNRTSVSGYIQTFINSVVSIAVIYYLPVYYQACKGASAMGSSVDTLPVSLILAPCAALGGFSVAKLKRYRPQIWLSWCILIIGMGLFTIVNADSEKPLAIGLSVILAASSGILYSGVYFPVLSPLPVSESALALSFHGFCRSFAGVWGVAIGAAVLQNQLAARLPPQVLHTVLGDGSIDSSNVNLAYSIIPLVHVLPEPLRREVRAAFGVALSVIWKTSVGVLAIGLFASLLMRDVPLHTNLDEKWGISDGDKSENVEANEKTNCSTSSTSTNESR